MTKNNTKPTEKSAESRSERTVKHSSRNPLAAISGYFKGAWHELRQVRWPNRAATWGLTFAVIVFSLFFAVIILGLDSAFSYLFKEILL